MKRNDTDTYFTHRWSPLASPSSPLPPELPAGSRVLVDWELFGDGVTDDLRRHWVYACMALNPDVRFLLLTGKPSRMREYVLNKDSHLAMTRCFRNFRDYDEPVGPWPLPNVMPGIRLTDQSSADRLLSELLSVPAARRWAMVEPEGPVDLSYVHFNRHCVMNVLEGCGTDRRSPCQTIPNARCSPLAWIIIPHHEPDLSRVRLDDWFRWHVAIRDQCRAAGVPLWSGVTIDGEIVREFPIT